MWGGFAKEKQIQMLYRLIDDIYFKHKQAIISITKEK